MNIITHLLVGWTLAEHTTKSPRDRALITVASVVPDLDGLGLIVDMAAPTFNWTVQWYERFHHQLLHGIPGALVCTALLTCFARERWRAACLIFVSFHLHLLGDLLGSRGGGVTDSRSAPYHYRFCVYCHTRCDNTYCYKCCASQTLCGRSIPYTHHEYPS